MMSRTPEHIKNMWPEKALHGLYLTDDYETSLCYLISRQLSICSLYNTEIECKWSMMHCLIEFLTFLPSPAWLDSLEPGNCGAAIDTYCTLKEPLDHNVREKSYLSYQNPGSGLLKTVALFNLWMFVVILDRSCLLNAPTRRDATQCQYHLSRVIRNGDNVPWLH